MTSYSNNKPPLDGFEIGVLIGLTIGIILMIIYK